MAGYGFKSYQVAGGRRYIRRPDGTIIIIKKSGNVHQKSPPGKIVVGMSALGRQGGTTTKSTKGE